MVADVTPAQFPSTPAPSSEVPEAVVTPSAPSAGLQSETPITPESEASNNPHSETSTDPESDASIGPQPEASNTPPVPVGVLTPQAIHALIETGRNFSRFFLLLENLLGVDINFQ